MNLNSDINNFNKLSNEYNDRFIVLLVMLERYMCLKILCLEDLSYIGRIFAN